MTLFFSKENCLAFAHYRDGIPFLPQATSFQDMFGVASNYEVLEVALQRQQVVELVP